MQRLSFAAIFFGVLVAVILVVAAQQMSNVLQAALAVFEILGRSLRGMFTLGIFKLHANKHVRNLDFPVSYMMSRIILLRNRFPFAPLSPVLHFIRHLTESRSRTLSIAGTNSVDRNR